MGPTEKVRLTQQVTAGGCASKLALGSLQAVLARLPKQKDERVLVGFDTLDDAGIFQISPDLALVHTVDFFTPMVDDPYTFGQIAAANALSDVYAMGGRPISALALVCFPDRGDLSILEKILSGGLAMMAQADCAVVGGHSVRDLEIKFGYSVTGLIDPGRIYTNAGAKPGDALILTKALGVGVLTTALKRGQAPESWVQGAIKSMTTLNDVAVEALKAYHPSVHAVTDVTGFGLIGHGRELASASKVVLEINVAEIPMLEGALDAIRMEAVPAGLLSNREFAECVVSCVPGSDISLELRTLLYDPQTSGGLLVSMASPRAENLVAQLRNLGLAAANIGKVSDPEKVRAKAGHIILH
jgi:selenide,water dikinase